MSSRRDFLKTTGFGLLLQVLPEALHAQSRAGTEFDRLLQSTIENEALISMGRDLRERQIDEFEFYAARGVAPRKGRSGRPISERAAKLIVSFEVTDQKAYQQKYQGAIWPQGQSGITIGIGYDVGYVTKVWLHEDWDGLVEPTQLSLLEIACEVPGPRAQGMLPRLSSIKIPWSTAYQERFTYRKHCRRSRTAISFPMIVSEHLFRWFTTGERPLKAQPTGMLR